MFINLPRLSILPQQSTQNSLSSHPHDSGRHPSFRCPLSFSRTGMSPFSLCSVSFTDAETGVHDGGFFDDEAVGVEFSNVLAGVGVADFGGFIWIEPDFAFAAVEDFGGKSLLGAEVGHFGMRVGGCRGGVDGGGE